jgi:hypothetical protein
MADSRNSRFLNGDYTYVHIDISDQLTAGNKIAISVVWLACYVVIVSAPKQRKGWIALTCGTLCVILRHAMRPQLDIRSSFC